MIKSEMSPSNRSLNSYKFFDGPNADGKLVKQRLSPISMDQNPGTWFALNMDVNTSEYYEESYNLLAGTINLVNYIEERRRQGYPVKTLVYLDKAGRLAAYALTTFYRHLGEMNPKGQIIASHKPGIRFINVGHEEHSKFSDKNALRHLAQLYRAQDIQPDSTLIVDEFAASGASARHTISLLQNTKYGMGFQAMGEFYHCPKWYYRKSAKGVEDPDFITDTTRKHMAWIYKWRRGAYKKAHAYIHTYGWRAFNEYFYSDKPRANPHNLPKDAIGTIQSLSCNAYTVTEFLQYMASEGGFLALSPKKEYLEQSTMYRENLKLTIERAFEQHLIHINP